MLDKFKSRELFDLFTVLVAAITLAMFSVSLRLIDRIYNFFAKFSTLPIAEFIINVGLLTLMGLLWLTYRYWREASEKAAELEKIVDSISPDVLIVVDPSRNILKCNRSIERAFGYSPDEVINQKTEILYSDRRPDPGKGIEICEALKREGFHIGLAMGKKKNGETMPLEIITGRLSAGDGAVLLLRDITERKRAEEEKSKLEAKLQQVRKMEALGTLAGGLGHELRNPLGAMKNTVYFLNMALKEPSPDIKEALGILNKEIETSEGVIKSLHDFTRPVAPARLKVDVNDIVQAAMNRVPVPEKIQVVTRLNEALPNIPGDPEQLIQAFRNFILNAFQAMPEGGRLVVKSEAPSEEQVTVSFTDRGEGMDEETLRNAFEPLFTTKAKGMGLGLALTEMLIEAHGGTIDVESEVGKGTTFTIKLPIGENKQG